MRPRVVIHNAAGPNGILSGFDIDLGLYYRLAGELACEATLVGSGTVLAAPEAAWADDPHEVIEPDSEHGSLLVVPDSRGRVHCWGALRASGLWKRFVSLTTAATPAEHLSYLRNRGVSVIETGNDKVDLSAALSLLRERYAVESVRVDSGGTLNGILLAAGLVDEVSLIVEPQFVLSNSGVPFVRPPVGDAMLVPLRLTHMRRFDGGEVWLRWDVLSTGEESA